MKPLTITLKRNYQPEHTKGVLKVSDLTLYTLEPPWVDNKTDKSCIPEGEYQLKRILRSDDKIAFQLLNVPGRTEVLIHKGNYIWETKGCILPGTNRGSNQVWHSAIAMKALDRILKMFEDVQIKITSDGKPRDGLYKFHTTGDDD